MSNMKMWTTREGEKIRVRNMTDSHIQNTMKMLERVAIAKKNEDDKLACVFEGSVHGDMATYYAEQTAMQQYQTEWTSYLPDIYWDLKDELKRRENE